MDKAVAALSDIELNALLAYCNGLDVAILDIPYYQVVNPVIQESYDGPDDCQGNIAKADEDKKEKKETGNY